MQHKNLRAIKQNFPDALIASPLPPKIFKTTQSFPEITRNHFFHQAFSVRASSQKIDLFENPTTL
jgi:hypothetical protein